jgi:hypothetical protein
MGKELGNIHHTHPGSLQLNMPAPSGEDWALNFIQQSSELIQPHPEFPHEFEEFEKVFGNIQQQRLSHHQEMNHDFNEGTVIIIIVTCCYNHI